MKAICHRLFACAAVVFLVPVPAPAQAPFSIEVRAGAGPTRGTGYGTTNQFSYGAILDVPVLGPPALQLLLGADAEQIGSGPVRVTACGGCSGAISMPGLGYAAAVGVRTTRVLGDLRFRAEYGSVKVSEGRTHPGVSATLDTGIRISGPVELVVGGRVLRFTLSGTTVDAYQLSFGVRL